MDFLRIISFFFFSMSLCSSAAKDTLKPGEILRGNQTLVSPLGVFESGFFLVGKAPKQYLGVWLKNDKFKKPVWVFNVDTPLLDSSAVLYVSGDGDLVTGDVRGIPMVVNNKRVPRSNDTACRLLDTGNLVLFGNRTIIWQSFDSPTDTFLPGMKLGWFDMDTDHTRKLGLSSWLSPLDPSRGPFLCGIDPVNRTQIKTWRTTDTRIEEIGAWDGQNFSFVFATASKNYNFSFVSNEREDYLTFHNTRSGGAGSIPSSWFELAPNGDINEVVMVGDNITIWNHSVCGGCLGMLSSSCLKGEEFSEIRASVTPSSATVSFTARLGLADCKLACKDNCSCSAYTYNGESTECLLYFGDGSGLKELNRGNRTVFVRGKNPVKSDRRRNLLLKIVVPISCLMILIVFFFSCCLWRRKSNIIGIDMTRSGQRKGLRISSVLLCSNTNPNDKSRNVQQLFKDEKRELPLLSFSSILSATENFSFENKIGEGGFGPVYKGELSRNKIAVKRLSKFSGQGFEEFTTEVKLISKLQHRNLVKLLGYCIHEEEKLLVYEYMDNKSLDTFIFDSKRGTELDWGQRIRIVKGIAHGLLYLHEYSRLRVIHRDLKMSNILLDSDMNPKISDFGMARIFRENESQGVTRRVVGTYGYMSPEYAAHGHFSTKSDVFSYGVILLEIVSGRKSTSTFEYTNHPLSLLGYAWKLWRDDCASELMDPTLADSCRVSELQLCMHVALMCVQDDPERRPAMSDVVAMLGDERSALSAPSQPTFSTYASLPEVRIDSQIQVTISALEPR